MVANQVPGDAEQPALERNPAIVEGMCTAVSDFEYLRRKVLSVGEAWQPMTKVAEDSSEVTVEEMGPGIGIPPGCRMGKAGGVAGPSRKCFCRIVSGFAHTPHPFIVQADRKVTGNTA